LVGGTSAAAPLWAGLAALVNQQRAAGGSTALGFANPALYSLGVASPTVYNDVFSGNNGVFSANAGYDNATGWGSFRADNMISACSGLVVSTTVVASTGATTTISLLGLSGSITVTIPPGAFPLTETVTAAVPSVTPPPSAGASGRVTPLGPAVDITLSRPIAQFLKPVTLQMQLAATGVDPKLIKLAWWDQGQAIWWPELQASYDPLAGTVTGQIWHNTIHAAVAVQAAADLNKVKVFPDPIDFATAVRGTVKFMGMTPNATIRVYNLAGERVVTIPPGAANGATVNDGASGTAEWDGRNSYGSPVARGTYVYVIKDDNGKETRGKFAVVR
jgi:hypothetical protein